MKYHVSTFYTINLVTVYCKWSNIDCFNILVPAFDSNFIIIEVIYPSGIYMIISFPIIPSHEPSCTPDLYTQTRVSFQSKPSQNWVLSDFISNDVLTKEENMISRFVASSECTYQLGLRSCNTFS